MNKAATAMPLAWTLGSFISLVRATFLMMGETAVASRAYEKGC